MGWDIIDTRVDDCASKLAIPPQLNFLTPLVRSFMHEKKKWHEIFMQEYLIFMHENCEISMQESDISVNENFAPGLIFFTPDVFMGICAVHTFLHGILIQENFGAKFSFYCVKIKFSCK